MTTHEKVLVAMAVALPIYMAGRTLASVVWGI